MRHDHIHIGISLSNQLPEEQRPPRPNNHVQQNTNLILHTPRTTVQITGNGVRQVVITYPENEQADVLDQLATQIPQQQQPDGELSSTRQDNPAPTPTASIPQDRGRTQVPPQQQPEGELSSTRQNNPVPTPTARIPQNRGRTQEPPQQQPRPNKRVRQDTNLNLRSTIQNATNCVGQVVTTYPKHGEADALVQLATQIPPQQQPGGELSSTRQNNPVPTPSASIPQDQGRIQAPSQQQLEHPSGEQDHYRQQLWIIERNIDNPQDNALASLPQLEAERDRLRARLEL